MGELTRIRLSFAILLVCIIELSRLSLERPHYFDLLHHSRWDKPDSDGDAEISVDNTTTLATTLNQSLLLYSEGEKVDILDDAELFDDNMLNASLVNQSKGEMVDVVNDAEISIDKRKRWETMFNQSLNLMHQEATCSWRNEWDCASIRCHKHKREVLPAAPQNPAPVCKTLWFAGMSEESFDIGRLLSNSYATLYLAALESVYLHSQDVLQPVLMLNEYGNSSSNAENSSLAKFASSRGAIVINIDELSIQNAIDTIYNKPTDGHRIGPFMRMDIPHVVHKAKLFDKPGICDTYALYTDSDVLFPNPISHQDMQLLKEAMGPTAIVLYGREHSTRRQIRNTGVMLIDVPGFEAELPDIVDFGLEEETAFIAFDQGWLNEYFYYTEGKQALLPIYWNWKTYWRLKPSDFTDIKILHYHGPKPGKCLENVARCDPPDRTCPIEGYLYLIEEGVCCDRGRTASLAMEMTKQLLSGIQLERH